MNTFTYSYPVKTFFGEGAARDNLPDLLDKYGQNVMLPCDSRFYRHHQGLLQAADR